MPAHIKVSDNYTKGEKRKAYEGFWREMMPYVREAVVDSFAKGVHAMRNPTKGAVQERVDMCKKLVDTMRQDLKWSKFRIRDTIGYHLRAKLSGIEVPMDSMAKRNSWLARRR